MEEGGRRKEGEGKRRAKQKQPFANPGGGREGRRKWKGGGEMKLPKSVAAGCCCWYSTRGGGEMPISMGGRRAELFSEGRGGIVQNCVGEGKATKGMAEEGGLKKSGSPESRITHSFHSTF